MGQGKDQGSGHPTGRFSQPADTSPADLREVWLDLTYPISAVLLNAQHRSYATESVENQGNTLEKLNQSQLDNKQLHQKVDHFFSLVIKGWDPPLSITSSIEWEVIPSAT